MTADAQARVNPEDVTLGATAATASGPYKHLYVGIGGDVVIVTKGGSASSPEITTTFKNVPTGYTIWDANCAYVKDVAGGTTATNIVGYK